MGIKPPRTRANWPTSLHIAAKLCVFIPQMKMNAWWSPSARSRMWLIGPWQYWTTCFLDLKKTKNKKKKLVRVEKTKICFSSTQVLGCVSWLGGCRSLTSKNHLFFRIAGGKCEAQNRKSLWIGTTFFPFFNSQLSPQKTLVGRCNDPYWKVNIHFFREKTCCNLQLRFPYWFTLCCPVFTMYQTCTLRLRHGVFGWVLSRKNCRENGHRFPRRKPTSAFLVSFKVVLDGFFGKVPPHPRKSSRNRPKKILLLVN